MPKVYVIPEEAPNAFATGRNPEHAAVAATQGLLRLMSRDEIEGVIAHELGHVKNRDTLIMTVAATMAGALSHLATMALWFGGGRTQRRPRGGQPARRPRRHPRRAVRRDADPDGDLPLARVPRRRGERAD